MQPACAAKRAGDMGCGRLQAATRASGGVSSVWALTLHPPMVHTPHVPSVGRGDCSDGGDLQFLLTTLLSGRVVRDCCVEFLVSLLQIQECSQPQDSHMLMWHRCQFSTSLKVFLFSLTQHFGRTKLIGHSIWNAVKTLCRMLHSAFCVVQSELSVCFLLFSC